MNTEYWTTMKKVSYKNMFEGILCELKYIVNTLLENQKKHERFRSPILWATSVIFVKYSTFMGNKHISSQYLKNITKVRWEGTWITALCISYQALGRQFVRFYLKQTVCLWMYIYKDKEHWNRCLLRYAYN